MRSTVFINCRFYFLRYLFFTFFQFDITPPQYPWGGVNYEIFNFFL